MKELLGKVVIVNGYSTHVGNFFQVGQVVDCTPNSLILSHSSNELKKENRSVINIAHLKGLAIVDNTTPIDINSLA